MHTYLNIACGDTFVRDPRWENVDYVAQAPWVRGQNILSGMRTTQPRYEVVYCSHFLEHVPAEQAADFLATCRRLTSDRGLLRLVVPDAEMLVREYTQHRDRGDAARADYAFTLLLDQCVRRRGGGRLGEFDRRIANGEWAELREYAEYLVGPVAARSPSAGGTPKSGVAGKIARILARPTLVLDKLELAYVRAVCAFLPRAFREQNVAFTAVGERHLWMYDAASLTTLLLGAGYNRVDRVTFQTSGGDARLFAELDAVDGAPRKGHHQLFIEARP